MRERNEWKRNIGKGRNRQRKKEWRKGGKRERNEEAQYIRMWEKTKKERRKERNKTRKNMKVERKALLKSYAQQSNIADWCMREHNKWVREKKIKQKEGITKRIKNGDIKAEERKERKKKEKKNMILSDNTPVAKQDWRRMSERRK